MCSVRTFIQVHTDWQKYWHVLQCSLTELSTHSQIYSLAEYLSDGLLVYALIRPLLRTGLHTRFGLTDRSQPIRFSACTTNPANVDLVSQQVGRAFYAICGNFERNLLAHYFLLVPRESRVFIEDYLTASNQFSMLRVPLWPVVGDKSISVEVQATSLWWRTCVRVESRYSEREREAQSRYVYSEYQQQLQQPTFTKGNKVTLYSDWLRATTLYTIYRNSSNLGCPKRQCEYGHYTLVFYTPP